MDAHPAIRGANYLIDTTWKELGNVVFKLKLYQAKIDQDFRLPVVRDRWKKSRATVNEL